MNNSSTTHIAETKQTRTLELLWYAFIFSFMYIWFTQIHPLIVFDTDDWTYIAHVRYALPIWGDWNPSRVFPEVFMPLVSAIGVHLLMPLVNDYLLSITIASACFISLFIVIYIRCFTEMLKRLFCLSASSALLVSLFFFILHFLVFRKNLTSNSTLFDSGNLNCHYNYLLSGLLNSSLVMHMVANPQYDQPLSAKPSVQSGFLFLFIYLAIFSHLPSSGILAAYAGAILLIRFIADIQTGFELRTYFRFNITYLLILVLWAVSAVFELSGGRAAAVSAAPFAEGLLSTFRLALTGIPSLVGEVFCLAVLAVAVVAAYCLITVRKGNNDTRCFVSFLIAILLATAAMCVYALVLCAKVSPDYILMSGYQFGFWFFIILIISTALAYIIKIHPSALLGLPVFLLVLFTKINTVGITFAQPYSLNKNTYLEISSSLFNQVVEASENGQTQMELHVPMWNTAENWPHTADYGSRMSIALYEHGIIASPIQITIVPDKAISQEFGIPRP